MSLAMTDPTTDCDHPGDYPPLAVTVDVAAFTIHDGAVHVALVRRAAAPSRGSWTLPGGFLRLDEDLEAAATRELQLGTGLRGADWHVEQLGSYRAPGRDARGHVVTVAYLAVCAEMPRPRRGGDAGAAFRPLDDVGSLAFDHGAILGDALERIRSKMEYTTLGVRFLKPAFTVTELRGVYETVWGLRLDEGNFQRSFRGNTCFRRVGGAQGPRGRPASLWSEVGTSRRGQVRLLDRPLARRNAKHHHVPVTKSN